MTTEAMKRAVARYDKIHTTQIVLKLNKRTDADILDHLYRIDNRQGYIKELIRKDMMKAGQ